MHSTLNKNEPKFSNQFLNKIVCILSSQWTSQTSANSMPYTSAAINPTLQRLDLRITEITLLEERERKIDCQITRVIVPMVCKIIDVWFTFVPCYLSVIQIYFFSKRYSFDYWRAPKLRNVWSKHNQKEKKIVFSNIVCLINAIWKLDYVCFRSSLCLRMFTKSWNIPHLV